MSCPLTQGVDYICDDSIGGIKQGTIKIARTEDLTLTVVADEVTAISQVALSNFYEYKINKEIADMTAPITSSEETGTFFVEAVLNFTLNQISKEKNAEMKLLASKPVTIIFQDQNGTWLMLGADSGCRMMGGTNQVATGKAFGDLSGYTLGFTSKEGHLPYTVDATVVAGLTVA